MIVISILYVLRTRARCLLVAAFFALQASSMAHADDAADGKSAFAVCSTCHSINGGKGLGPPLNGVIGRKAGSAPGFNYSPAMRRAEIVWDETALNAFIENPQRAVVGNRMPFPGLPDASKRARIIDYLKTLN